jgi:glycosyltransferase involved in cell wall biosynthesis
MQKELNCPRVLIIGQGFNLVDGGGITLTNLFKGFPKNQLALATNEKKSINLNVCENYYILGSLEDYWVWPFSYIKRTGKVSGPVPIQALNDGFSFENKDPEATISRSTFYTIINFLGIEDLSRRLKVSKQFLTWVKAFSPDLIYSQLASLSLIRFVDDLSETMQIPSVIHMMDDWPSTVYRSGLFSAYMRWRTDVEFRRLITRSTTLGISQAMYDEYKDRYGREFIPFHNPIDLDIWINNSKKTWEAGSTFKVRYGGRIGNAIQESILDIAEAIEEICNGGLSITFDLYIDLFENEFMNKLKKYKSAHVYAKLPYEQVPISIASADLLVIPYDFDRQSLQFIQYSMSTKVTEYMGSGTPILVYAPEETAVAKYACKDKWGSVVSRRNKTLLKQTIIQLIQNPNLRESLGLRAKALVIQNHDAAKVRLQFRQILAGATKSFTNS